MIYYDYCVSVRYSDLGEDSLLSDSAILSVLQEAALCADPLETGDPETQTYAWALCSWSLRIHRRPRWAERLQVRTWLRAMGRHTADREFTVTDAAGERVISASSRWLLLRYDTGRVADVTGEIMANYAFAEERAMEEAPEEGGCGAEAPCVMTYTVLRRDIDSLHHMNNLHYVTLAREALPDEAAAQPFERVEIVYKRQIKLGATVRFFYEFSGGKHRVELRNETGEVTHATVCFW